MSNTRFFTPGGTFFLLATCATSDMLRGEREGREGEGRKGGREGGRGKRGGKEGEREGEREGGRRESLKNKSIITK